MDSDRSTHGGETLHRRGDDTGDLLDRPFALIVFWGDGDFAFLHNKIPFIE